jgi:hypothetical protein
MAQPWKITPDMMIVMNAPLGAEAQHAAASLPHLRPSLAANRHISMDTGVWFALSDPLPDAATAASLYSRPLNPDQLDWVIAKEKRARPLAAACSTNPMTPAQIRTMLARSTVAKTVARALIDAEEREPGRTPAEVAGDVARAAGGNALCNAIAGDAFSDTEACELLDRFGDWADKPSRRRSLALTRILDARPGLIGRFVATGAHPSLLLAAAGSRHLTSEELQRSVLDGDYTADMYAKFYAWVSLAANPRTHRAVLESMSVTADIDASLNRARSAALKRLEGWETRGRVDEAFEDVTDSDTLTWLIRRSVPRESWDGDQIRGRPFDVAALAANPHLSQSNAQRVFSAMHDYSVSDALGTGRWDSLISAMRNRFDLPPESCTSNTGSNWTHQPEHDDTIVADPRSANIRVRYLSPRYNEAMAWIALQELDVAGWTVLFGLVADDDASDDTLGDLVNAARFAAG